MGLKSLRDVIMNGRKQEEQSLRLSPRLTGWRMVMALGLTTILSYGTTQYLFGVLEVPLATAFAWNRAELSGAYALSLLVAGVLGVPIGYLVDRFGGRILMTAGSILVGCALIALSQITYLWPFYLCWSGGLGLAMSLILYPVTFTVVTSWFVTDRARAFAVLTLVGGLASPIFIPLSGWLLPQVGWRATLFWYGVLHLVLAVPLHAWLVQRAPDHQNLLNRISDTASVFVSEASSTTRQALLSRRFWLLTAAYALALLGSAVVFAHQIAFLVSRGYGALLAATLAGALGLASLPGRFFPEPAQCADSTPNGPGGNVTRPGWRHPGPHPGTKRDLALAVCAALWAAFGALSPLRAQIMADHFGKRAYGAITGSQGIPLALCQAAGPLLAGWLFDTLHHYDLAFWLCAGSFVLAALLLGLPHPARQPGES